MSPRHSRPAALLSACVVLGILPSAIAAPVYLSATRRVAAEVSGTGFTAPEEEVSDSDSDEATSTSFDPFVAHVIASITLPVLDEFGQAGGGDRTAESFATMDSTLSPGGIDASGNFAVPGADRSNPFNNITTDARAEYGLDVTFRLDTIHTYTLQSASGGSNDEIVNTVAFTGPGGQVIAGTFGQFEGELAPGTYTLSVHGGETFSVFGGGVSTYTIDLDLADTGVIPLPPALVPCAAVLAGLGIMRWKRRRSARASFAHPAHRQARQRAGLGHREDCLRECWTGNGQC
jgi:hypothetical protein